MHLEYVRTLFGPGTCNDTRSKMQKEHGIPAAPVTTGLSPEELEAERVAEQEKIDNAVPLTEEEQAEKEALSSTGFENWSRRDYQQFVRALENHGWYALFVVKIFNES